jgi:hypothetical protein
MIESYTFGRVIIDGREYTSDVIIFPDHVEDNWCRKRGHSLMVEDVEKFIRRNQPEVIVLGTGKYGALEVLIETKQYLNARGVDLIAEKTDVACKTYNQLSHKKKVLGAFHLSC